ncbi:Uncharacterized protein ToN1_08130 [Aromatoleum petrolei]|nr:Uncharacterized protein ToN1_08130 [Aromatoleum petrolei]
MSAESMPAGLLVKASSATPTPEVVGLRTTHTPSQTLPSGKTALEDAAEAKLPPA